MLLKTHSVIKGISIFAVGLSDLSKSSFFFFFLSIPKKKDQKGCRPAADHLLTDEFDVLVKCRVVYKVCLSFCLQISGLTLSAEHQRSEFFKNVSSQVVCDAACPVSVFVFCFFSF